MQRRDRVSLQDVPAEGFRVASVKGLPVRRHFVKNCAQTEEIRPSVDRFTTHLLRRHVMQNRGNAPLNVLRKTPLAGQAESQDLYGPIPATHDLGRLQAVMKDLLRVGMV